MDGFIAIYKALISEFKPDGLRIDTVKHVDLSFWQQFTPAIIAHARAQGIPQFHVFGEVYDGDPAVLSRYTTAGQLPAVLDFAFQGAVTAVFAQQQSPQRLAALFNDDDYYSDADSDADLLMTFTGNHDMGRFGWFLNRELGKAPAQEKLQRSRLAHALMYFARGIPVVYYGDEQGFTGDGHDQDAREDMMPSRVASYNDNPLLGSSVSTAASNFDGGHPLYRDLAEFSRIYRAHSALRRGVHYNRHADEQAGIYAFSRLDPALRIEYLLVFNSDTREHRVVLGATAREYAPVAGASEALTARDGTVEVTVAPLEFAIYRAQQPLPVVSDLGLSLTRVAVDPRAPDRLLIEYLVAATEQQPLPMLRVTTELEDHNGRRQLLSRDSQPRPTVRDRHARSSPRGRITGCGSPSTTCKGTHKPGTSTCRKLRCSQQAEVPTDPAQRSKRDFKMDSISSSLTQ